MHCQNNDNVVTVSEGLPSLLLHHSDTEPPDIFDTVLVSAFQEKGQQLT